MSHTQSRYFWILLYVSVLSVFYYIGIEGSRYVTVIASNAALDNRKCIIIDAGHGGEDGGATSCTGVLEKEINLEISLRLQDLMHLLGLKTEMLRNTDTALSITGDTIAQRKRSDLEQRVKKVNQISNGLLLSIHQNYYSDSKYRGAQMFYNQTSQGEDLAMQLQAAIHSALDKDNNRSIKESTAVFLMKKVTCPAVLIECGFLSNPQEEHLLRDPVYQKKMCCVIASVCSCYLYHESDT